MEQKKWEELTDQELLQEAKNRKSRSPMNAVWIGFLIGVIIFSVVKSSWGLVTLIPLFFIYKLMNKSKEDQALSERLKERGLK